MTPRISVYSTRRPRPLLRISQRVGLFGISPDHFSPLTPYPGTISTASPHPTEQLLPLDLVSTEEKGAAEMAASPATRLVSSLSLVLLLCLTLTVRAFYIPGVAPTEYDEGDGLEIKVR